jgi:hypothetical protein
MSIRDVGLEAAAGVALVTDEAGLLERAMGWVAWGRKRQKENDMKRTMPGKREIVLFAVIAVVCALLAGFAAARDVALAGMAVPVFVVGALLGMKRTGKLAGEGKVAEEKPEEVGVGARKE